MAFVKKALEARLEKIRQERVTAQGIAAQGVKRHRRKHARLKNSEIRPLDRMLCQLRAAIAGGAYKAKSLAKLTYACDELEEAIEAKTAPLSLQFKAEARRHNEELQATLIRLANEERAVRVALTDPKGADAIVASVLKGSWTPPDLE